MAYDYSITTADILSASDDDCLLSDADRAFVQSFALGGLGGAARLAEYRASQLPQFNQKTAEQLAYEKTLEPGTEPWFKHHFSRNL